MIYRFVEERLEEAARQGAFDDLPNAGRPLDLSENPWLAPEWRPAFRLLRDHRILPEFLERRRQVESIRSEMTKARSRAVYEAEVRRLAAAVEALNRSLVRENHFVRGSLQLPPVDIDAELRAFDEKG